MTVNFEVIETAPMTLTRPNRLADMYTLSPFVWREDDGYHLLLRAVPRRNDEPRLKIAEIWHGLSADGLHFEMDEAPVIFPGPDLADLDGCEDPTVLVTDGQLRVWYSGWNQQQDTDGFCSPAVPTWAGSPRPASRLTRTRRSPTRRKPRSRRARTDGGYSSNMLMAAHR